MLADLERFFSIVFRQHFVVWVTGTGIVGFLLWAAGFFQNITRFKLSPRRYIFVLFCVFWFLGAYSAWRDADKNLTDVIVQRSNDNSQLGTCRSELQMKSTFLSAQNESIHTLQSTLNSQQGQLNSQQGTLNSCVVSLGKLNPLVNFKITTLVMPVTAWQKRTRFGIEDEYLFEGVIITNHPAEPKGIFKCDQPFELIGPAALSNQSPHAMGLIPPLDRVSDREYRIQVINYAAAWVADNLIHFPIASGKESLGNCTFKEGW
jgi:hypothetical protein